MFGIKARKIKRLTAEVEALRSINSDYKRHWQECIETNNELCSVLESYQNGENASTIGGTFPRFEELEAAVLNVQQLAEELEEASDNGERIDYTEINIAARRAASIARGILHGAGIEGEKMTEEARAAFIEGLMPDIETADAEEVRDALNGGFDTMKRTFAAFKSARAAEYYH